MADILKVKKIGMKNPKTQQQGFAARAIANGTADFEKLARLAARNTTMHVGELELALKLAMEAAAEAVAAGQVVDLGPMGKVRPAVSGKWVADPKELTLADLTPHLNYVASDALKSAVKGVKMAWTQDKETDDDTENGGDQNTDTNAGGSTTGGTDNQQGSGSGDGDGDGNGGTGGDTNLEP